MSLKCRIDRNFRNWMFRVTKHSLGFDFAENIHSQATATTNPNRCGQLSIFI